MRKRLLNNAILSNDSVGQIDIPCNVLGIDYGEKFTGVAYGVKGAGVIPLKVIETGDDLVTEIQGLIDRYQIALVVFGLPHGLGGKENPLTRRIRKFSKSFPSVRIDFVNEKFSSKLSVSKNERKDDLAALKILEFYYS